MQSARSEWLAELEQILAQQPDESDDPVGGHSAGGSSALSSWTSHIQELQAGLGDEDVNVDDVLTAKPEEPIQAVKRRGRPPKFLRELRQSAEGSRASQHAQVVGGEERPAGSASSHQEDAESAHSALNLAALVTPDTSKLLPQVLNGVSCPSPLSKVLADIAEMLKLSPKPSDSDMAQMQAFFLHPSQYLLCSGKVQQKTLGMWRPAMLSKAHRLACTLLIENDRLRRQMEQRLVMDLPAAGLVFYTETAAYDETPMLCNVLQSALPLQGQQESQSDLPWDKLMASASSTQQVEKVIAKVSQSQICSGYLVRAADKFIELICPGLCPLQILSHNRAEVLFEILSRFSTSSTICNRFGIHCRAVCTDKARCNPKAEHMLSQSRDGQWPLLALPCDVHIIAACQSKTYQPLLQAHVSGIIRLALSLRVGTNFLTLKTCLQAEIATTLQLKVGPLPADAAQYKTFILNSYYDSQPKRTRKKMLALHGFNGDWRAGDTVEHYTDRPGCLQHRQEIVKLLSSLVLSIFCTCLPPLFRRDRWTGGIRSLDWICMLEGCHKLLSRSYKRFALSLSKPGTLLSGEVSRVQLPIGSSEGSSIMADDQAQVDPSVHISEAEEVGASSVGMGSSGTGDVDYAALNNKLRNQAYQWLLGRPFSHLMLWRIIMGPLDHMMQEQFKLASSEWETMQRAQAAKNAEVTSREQPDIVRQYRIMVAAELSIEETFFRELMKLFQSSDPWAFIEQHCLNISFRSLIFRVLSRAGCAVHQLLRHPHSCYPYRLYKVLKNPGCAPELEEAGTCQKDAWTNSLQARFGGFSSPAFRQCIMFQAMLVQTDISSIETKHASIRRQLVSRSTQTTTLPATTLSAEWVFQSIRSRQSKTRQRSLKVPLV